MSFYVLLAFPKSVPKNTKNKEFSKTWFKFIFPLIQAT